MPRPSLPAVLLLTAALAPAQSAPPAAPPAGPPDAAAPIAKEELRNRRAALVKAIAAANPGERIAVLVRGGTKQVDMGAFVQDQDFLYLSGVAEPDLALVLAAGSDGELAVDELLVPPFSRFAAVWDGNFLAPGEKTAQRTGFAVAGNVRGLAERMDQLLAADAAGKRPLLFAPTSAAARTGSTPGKAHGAAIAIAADKLDGRPSREEALCVALAKQHPGLVVQPLEPFVHELRWHKSDAEIAVLRRSAEIAAEGIAEAMKSARPGVYEYQLAAVARCVLSLRGAGPDAYAAIVGGGPNGCILHYNACTRQLLADDLIVMDYAGTLHGYASDVTRTFPASGKFSPEQRKLVTDVYEIQQALLADVRPGASLKAIGDKCARLLQERGYRNDHGPCHHVGLAVHDPSIDVLAPGMVITVEPGAYLRDKGMGCRIEDTVLVTADGYELLSKGVPSTPDEIEKLMAEQGLLDKFATTPR